MFWTGSNDLVKSFSPLVHVVQQKCNIVLGPKANLPSKEISKIEKISYQKINACTTPKKKCNMIFGPPSSVFSFDKIWRKPGSKVRHDIFITFSVFYHLRHLIERFWNFDADYTSHFWEISIFVFSSYDFQLILMLRSINISTHCSDNEGKCYKNERKMRFLKTETYSQRRIFRIVQLGVLGDRKPEML